MKWLFKMSRYNQYYRSVIFQTYQTFPGSKEGCKKLFAEEGDIAKLCPRCASCLKTATYCSRHIYKQFMHKKINFILSEYFWQWNYSSKWQWIWGHQFKPDFWNLFLTKKLKPSCLNENFYKPYFLQPGRVKLWRKTGGFLNLIL